MAGSPQLFERGAFEAFVLELPSATLVRQWGDSSVAKVGDKIFAVFGAAAGGPASISFKCSDLAFRLLPGIPGCRSAPYLARAKWIAADADNGLDPDELAAYLAEAHRLVVARLPRWRQQELGLDGLIAARPQRS